MNDDMIQKAFHDHGFTFEKSLGRGRYGCVYQVSKRSDSPDQKYAIKLLDTKKRDNDDAQKYRTREVQLLKTLGIWEKNVVQYYGHWDMTVGEIPYLGIQMELCWRDLLTFVYKNDMGGAEIVQAPGNPRLYQQVFPQILEGLKAIHSIGWVHRDIHYRNILVATPKPSRISQIKIKIADFGLARKIQPKEALTAFSKAAFSAPELLSQKYDGKVDLYSAGIVLYFLSRYIEDETRWLVEIEKLKRQAPFYDYLCFPDNILTTLIKSLTEKNPEDRPTAEKALTMINAPEDQPLQDNENPQSKATSFLAKKFGNEYWKRGTSEDFTLSSLTEKMYSITGIEPERQILVQHLEEADNDPIPVEIDDDNQVKQMFLSASTDEKRICIVVKEKNMDIPV